MRRNTSRITQCEKGPIYFGWDENTTYRENGDGAERSRTFSLRRQSHHLEPISERTNYRENVQIIYFYFDNWIS